MGWITPLYFTAIKCREREVRLEAIRFLSHGDCKEGIWDAALAAQVAKQVMVIEEQGPAVDPKVARTGASKESQADVGESRLPPEANRVFDVEVILPEGPAGTLGLVCKRRKEEGSCETLAMYRDAQSCQWTNGKA